MTRFESVCRLGAILVCLVATGCREGASHDNAHDEDQRDAGGADSAYRPGDHTAHLDTGCMCGIAQDTAAATPDGGNTPNEETDPSSDDGTDDRPDSDTAVIDTDAASDWNTDTASDPHPDGDSASMEDTASKADTETAPTLDSETEDPRPPLYVKGIRLSKLAMYQTVEIPIMVDRSPVNGEGAATVAGKNGLLRVFITLSTGWTPRPVTARLEIEGTGIPDGTAFDQTEYVTDSSVPQAPATTFNFSIPGHLITEDGAFTVSLLETTEREAYGSSDNARWPEQGEQPFNAKQSPPLNIVLVPIQYDADGSSRIADTGIETLDTIRDFLHAYYPYHRDDIEVSVTEPLPWGEDVTSKGLGWQPLLAGLADFRASRESGDDAYYYGLIDPVADISDYCDGNCVTGLAYVPTGPESGYARVAVGIGFDPEIAADTLLHELGHNHGLAHAPCGHPMPEQTDPDYPYPGGKIGSWGYDLLAETLIDPDTHFDIMGYCWPPWISDFFYEKLQTWSRAAIAHASMKGEPSTWRAATVTGDGDVIMGHALELYRVPSGTPVDVLFIDVTGTAFESTSGYVIPHSELGGGRVVFPAPPAGADAVTIDGSPPMPL